jgi:hypothetical protein
MQPDRERARYLVGEIRAIASRISENDEPSRHAILSAYYTLRDLMSEKATTAAPHRVAVPFLPQSATDPYMATAAALGGK